MSVSKSMAGVSLINRRGLLDTNILILSEWIDFNQLPVDTAISAVTLAELTVGPLVVSGQDERANAERARRIAVLSRVENQYNPIPFDVEAARIFGGLSAALAASGLKPRTRTADLMIAATAVANRLPLYTTNPVDFEAVSDIVTIVGVDVPE